MANPDLDKIISSVDGAIRQAYALGRRDALDHVARWAQTEETTSVPLALVAPTAHETPAALRAAPGAVKPGPARPATGTALSPRPRGFGALLRDFVYPG